ncbi:hypothetical protein p25 [Pyrus virus A]|uniref:Uncharacterized protein n=1 Tax=Pyrus virus A TaxID=3139198 RepID=A0AAU6RUS0_9CLOS
MQNSFDSECEVSAERQSIGITTRCFEYVTTCSQKIQHMRRIKNKEIKEMINNLRVCKRFFTLNNSVNIEVEDQVSKNFFADHLKIPNSILYGNEEVLTVVYSNEQVVNFCDDIICLLEIKAGYDKGCILDEAELRAILNSSGINSSVSSIFEKFEARILSKFEHSTHCQLQVLIDRSFIKDFKKYVMGIYFLSQKNLKTYQLQFAMSSMIKFEWLDGIGRSMDIKGIISN